MLFKLLFKLVGNIKFLISFTIIVIVAYSAWLNFSSIQQSPLAQLIPQLRELKLPAPPNFTPSPPPEPSSFPARLSVHINTPQGKVSYSAEVAISATERSLGLMYRTSLPPYNGMLFVFQEDSQYGFWMKNCEISLDMIFIDKDKRIVDIIPNVPTCKSIDPTQQNCPGYIPKNHYRYVLEVNAGSTATNNIVIGQEVQF